MRIFTTLFSILIFIGNTVFIFAGNKAEVIIPGQDPSQRPFVMAKGLKDGGDYLSKTILFRVKPNYRQNCKVNSIDNILPVQDFLNAIGAQDLARIYPKHEQPAQERNMLGQKLTDLSLIYSFKYTADMKLEKVINQLLSLGYFEYVEPWYVPKIVFTPNDPSLPSQYHLQGDVAGSINTINAWDITKGNASIIIAIVDTGTEPTHPDLIPNLLPGWDVAMNDNDPTWQGNNHGCHVSGCASAKTDNGIGVSSPGFNCSILPVKIADASGALVAAYPGITWAADNGATIINCSWAGLGGGSYGQDIVNYAAINKNCLVLASSGNVPPFAPEDLVYPSSFNNVYRVASTTSTDGMSGFSVYGFDVDWAAPGSSILSTLNGTGYGQMSGTSMSCPVSAGAAGLVQAQFGYTNAFQIGERLKQTCDALPSSTQYNAGKLGKGRIDVGTAVSAQPATSLVMNPITITDGNDNIFLPGENLSITGTFINYLDPASTSCSAVLSIVSGPGTITNGNFTIGALATLATNNNNSAPFTASISGSAAVNSAIKFKITITDGTFTGEQYFDVIVNEDYINITINDVFTSITSKGRIGYNLDGTQQGLGFAYQVPATPSNMLYEMSLMIGTSSTQVSDMFRETSTGNNDFASIVRVYKVNPATVSDFDVDGKFNDAPSAGGALPVDVHHNAYAWSTAPYRKFVIVKYTIINTSTDTLKNLYAGIVSDWDITSAGQNKSAYDAANKMGYCYDVSVANGLYAGIKLLTNSAPGNNYCLDNVGGGNGGADPTNFTTVGKYTVLSTARSTDGFPAGGGDVMDCVSSGPFSINSGDSIIVAFALIGGDDLADIQLSACAAQAKYDNGCTNPGVNDVENDNFWMYSFPNPAKNSVDINYNIVGYDNACIRVMNALGEVVITLDNLARGRNTLALDISKFSAGNYFYQLKAGEAVMTKKMTITK